jgi:predicted transcriptional regulator
VLSFEAMPAERLNVSLDPDYAAKLTRLAERTHLQEGTLARSLLSQAIDRADPDPGSVVELLDGIDGSFDRAQRGLGDARAGRTIGLDEL